MSGAAISLAAALSARLDETNRNRAQRAEVLAARLSAETRMTPLVAEAGSIGVYPRLGVLAPTADQREKALASLAGLGATRMYPASLDQLPALRPHLIGERHCPAAQEFCARLFTLPTHAGLHDRQIDAVVQTLGAL
jgi:dTDP-4-amino-4,6-dideoxygalactose transaminase